METENIFEKYGFNPFQFTPPDEIILDFHGRQVSFFKGCKRVLDLGSGRGLFLRELAKQGIEGLGVDSHLPSAQEARDMGCHMVDADIFSFFQSEENRKLALTCDGVYCCFVLEHLKPAEVFELLKLIKLHCAPNVRARFITHNPEDIDAVGSLRYGDLTHQRLYVPQVVGEMARSQGFKSFRYKTFLGTKLGKKDTLRRIRDWFIWGKHKWRTNYALDCFSEESK